MDRKKKIILAVVVLAAVAAALWIYWGQDVSLQSLFPEEQWYDDMTLLESSFEGHETFHADEDTAEAVLTHLNNAELKRGLPFDSWRGDSISVYTFYDDPGGTWLSILLIDDGRVHVVDFGQQKEYYFRGGEELYDQIADIVAALPSEEEN